MSAPEINYIKLLGNNESQSLLARWLLFGTGYKMFVVMFQTFCLGDYAGSKKPIIPVKMFLLDSISLMM